MTFKPGTSEDRALGAFIGLAVGDALGAAVEFCTKGKYEPLTDYRDGGPFNLIGGQWTDDTSQAICIAEGLLGDFLSVGNLRDRFCEWLYTGKNSSTGVAFDIGNGTRQVLEQHRAGQINRKTLENSGGNGAIMRLAPVALRYYDNFREALIYARRSGEATHSHNSSVDSVSLLIAILVTAIRAEVDLPKVIAGLAVGGLLLEDSELRLQFIKLVHQGSLAPDIINVDGYSITTLLAATQSFLRTHTFEECILDAVNKGGDTDSVGAVAGQIAGAYYGYSQIPERFLTKLWDHNRLVGLGIQLINERKCWTKADFLEFFLQ